MNTRSNSLFPALCFLLPNLLGFLIFTAGPVVFSLAASFTNWSLAQTIPFKAVGFDNFTDLLTTPDFYKFLATTIYLMLGIPVSIFGSLGLAVALSQKLRGIAVYRTLFYLPSFTSGVATMILWKALLNPQSGLLNYALNGTAHAFHAHGLPNGLLGSTYNLAGLDINGFKMTSKQFGIGARDAFVLMGVWGGIGGGNMLLYLAALTNVPQELYEAAQIDGARKWACFVNVTWPSLAPTTFFIVVMSIIGGFQSGFDSARVMTQGGPVQTTTTISYYIYSMGFQQFKMGYASAVSWVLFAIILVMTLINWKFGNQESNG